MPQFDVYKNPRGGPFPLLLDVQADLLARMATRATVPLAPLKRYGGMPFSRLNPTALIDGTDYVLVTQALAAIPAAVLGKPIASLANQRAEVIAALDFLITGS